MKEQIEQQLSVLVGLPLIRAGRAVDLEWFEFGEPHKRTRRDGVIIDVGEYALHLQCAWRIRTTHEIVVASHDVYYPPGDSRDSPDDFDWDIPNGNRRDHCMNSFLREHTSHPLIVTAVEADEVGSVKVSFTDNFVLDVFPNYSFTDADWELWRFFQIDTDASHFVITGQGIQE